MADLNLQDFYKSVSSGGLSMSGPQMSPYVPGVTATAPQTLSTQPQMTPLPQTTSQPTGPVLGTNTGAPSDNSGDLFNQLQSQVQEQARIDLENALTQFDKYEEETKLQRTGLVGQKERSVAEMEAGLGKSEKEAGRAKEEATEATQSAKRKALLGAKDIVRNNRRIMRAMGILSSSAAGEMLSRPMTEYGRQSGELEQGLIKRLGTVKDWWLERQGEFDRAKNNLIAQFDELMGKIDIDLRFNEKDKINAVKAAQNALQQRTQEIQIAATGYQQQAQQYSNDILMQIAQIKLYQNPQADMSGILGAMINPQQQTTKTSNVGFAGYQTDEEKEKYGLLGSYSK